MIPKERVRREGTAPGSRAARPGLLTNRRTGPERNLGYEQARKQKSESSFKNERELHVP